MLSSVQILYLITGHTVIAKVSEAYKTSAILGGDKQVDPDSITLERPVQVTLVPHQGQTIPMPQPFGGLLTAATAREEFQILRSHVVVSVDAPKEVEDLHMEWTSKIAMR
ncbi:hypothetical protein [Achromobacter phage Motura]|uniref:Uncharacterized protein n=1 Tax=Achromobacter phage Motura TaxID=2591403 RepID=A0A514CSN1_9CAUD|nr:hypothetical protein H1O15_gp336 [Achromobacter phage Motura]QDH83470.1 hypothetical protein [Achromobacter phage Motura]